jgi:hypothetical protein
MRPALLVAFCHFDSYFQAERTSGFQGKVCKFLDKPANPYKGKDADGGRVIQWPANPLLLERIETEKLKKYIKNLKNILSRIL